MNKYLFVIDYFTIRILVFLLYSFLDSNLFYIEYERSNSNKQKDGKAKIIDDKNNGGTRSTVQGILCLLKLHFL